MITERNRRMRSIRVLNLQVEELRRDFSDMKDTLERIVGTGEAMAGSLKWGVRLLGGLAAIVALALLAQKPDALAALILIIRKACS